MKTRRQVIEEGVASSGSSERCQRSPLSRTTKISRSLYLSGMIHQVKRVCPRVLIKPFYFYPTVESCVPGMIFMIYWCQVYISGTSRTGGVEPMACIAVVV